MHKHIRIAPNHSVEYVSLGRRIKEIGQGIQADPAFFAELAEHVVFTRSPLRAIVQLGLRAHPSCDIAEQYRDRIYSKAILVP